MEGSKEHKQGAYWEAGQEVISPVQVEVAWPQIWKAVERCDKAQQLAGTHMT